VKQPIPSKQRHCEPTGRREAPPDGRLREAIHLQARVGCFVACAPLRKRCAFVAGNDDKTQTYDLAARSARVVQELLPAQSEGAGKPGAWCTRGRAWSVENTRVSHHRFTGTPGLPCAMVLTVSFGLSPVTGLVCHRRQRSELRQLDASVGASGPHDFAVRNPACSSVTPPASIASHPASVTIAIRPTERWTAVNMKVIWVRREQEYFCKGGWTYSPNQAAIIERARPWGRQSRCLVSAAPLWKAI
jgi:hypothetical protein